MKKSILKNTLLLFLASGLVLISCKKDESDPEPEDTKKTEETSPCDGGDGFCMDYGTVNKSGPAKLIVYNQSKIRVFWEQGEGETFEQVELDVYGLTPGIYDANDLAIDGSAFVQYYSQSSGTNNVAYGTVEVTELDTNGVVTGTFNVTMRDSTKITNGVFTNISK